MTYNEEPSEVFLSHLDLEDLYQQIYNEYKLGFPYTNEDQYINMCVNINGICYYDEVLFKNIIIRYLSNKKLLELPDSIYGKNQAKLVFDLFLDLEMFDYKEDNGDVLYAIK